MSKIAKLFEADQTMNSIDFAWLAEQALPDIKSIAEWIDNLFHKDGCAILSYKPDAPTKCTCGLSEIQFLIRR